MSMENRPSYISPRVEHSDQVFTRSETDQEALVEKYGKFVRMVARRFARKLPKSATAIDYNDLVQVGMEGLLAAANRFEADKGATFLHYASFDIRGRMMNEITAMQSTVRVPSYMRTKIRKVENINTTRLSQRKSPLKDVEISKAVDLPVGHTVHSNFLSVQTLHHSRLITDHMGSLDRGYAPHQDMSPGNEYILEDVVGLSNITREPEPSPDEVALARTLPAIVAKALENLDPQERSILEQRFGLDKRTPRTLDEVGKISEVSPEKARKVEQIALSKLRIKSRESNLLRELI